MRESWENVFGVLESTGKSPRNFSEQKSGNPVHSTGIITVAVICREFYPVARTTGPGVCSARLMLADFFLVSGCSDEKCLSVFEGISA